MSSSHFQFGKIVTRYNSEFQEYAEEFSPKDNIEYTHAHWHYLKEGVDGEV